MGVLERVRENLNALLERAARRELEQQREVALEEELQRRRSSQNAQQMERERRIAMEAAARARGKKRGAKHEPMVAHAAGRAHRLRTLYAELGVPDGSTLEDVKRAYRALMRAHHPDRHPGDKTASDRAAAIGATYQELETLLAR